MLSFLFLSIDTRDVERQVGSVVVVVEGILSRGGHDGGEKHHRTFRTY
jgi:hypothetical protein